MKFLRYTILVSMFQVLYTSSDAQGFLKASGTRIINEKGENVLLRGMGLGGWMLQEGYMLRIGRDGQQHRIRMRIDSLVGPAETQKFYDAWLSNHTRKIDIDSMKAWGFNSVRLAMHYNLYTLPVEQEPTAGNDTWIEKGFEMTDSLLSWCRQNELYLILDLHAAPGGQGNDLNISDGDTSKPFLWQSEENMRKTVALWKKLAQRYRDEPYIGAYDIINEPNYGFTDPIGDPNGLKEKDNVPLRKLMVDITNAIRSVDTKHLIIIEGNGWGNNYSGVLPPWDNNMALSFHKYWNFNDEASIAHIIAARDKYQVPVWLGETGENSNVWFTEAIRLFENNNIGWAWWPLKKLGFNNPLEIRSNPDYDELVQYWSGRGHKPDRATAMRALTTLGEDLKLENNIVHRDVIDAMFRQPHSADVIPFRQHVLTNTLKLPAVDYDLGRNGAAYYDLDTANYRVSGKPGAGNKGRVYRNDGVDIQLDSSDNRPYVFDFRKSEWMQYTLNVPAAGSYTLSLEARADSTSAIVSVQLGDRVAARNINVPHSSSTKKWNRVELSNIKLTKGTNRIRVRVEEGVISLKSIELDRI